MKKCTLWLLLWTQTENRQTTLCKKIKYLQLIILLTANQNHGIKTAVFATDYIFINNCDSEALVTWRRYCTGPWTYLAPCRWVGRRRSWPEPPTHDTLSFLWSQWCMSRAEEWLRQWSTDPQHLATQSSIFLYYSISMNNLGTHP